MSVRRRNREDPTDPAPGVGGNSIEALDRLAQHQVAGDVIRAMKTPPIPPYDAIWGHRLARLMVAVDGLEISEDVKNMIEHLARWETLTAAAEQLLERARRGPYPDVAGVDAVTETMSSSAGGDVASWATERGPRVRYDPVEPQ